MDPVTLIVSALALAACVEPLLRDGFEVDDAKRALGDYSLVRGAPGDLLTVHRLVQAITLDRLDESPRRLAGCRRSPGRSRAAGGPRKSGPV